MIKLVLKLRENEIASETGFRFLGDPGSTVNPREPSTIRLNLIKQEDLKIISQQRFWSEMTELKVHIEYLGLFHIESIRMDTSIDVFLAIVSNGSIAGWIIWSKAQFIWASIIAFSHLITAIRPHLPYQRRTRIIESLKSELIDLLLDTEEKWYSVAEGMLTEAEIHEIILGIKRRKNKAMNLYLSSHPLPRNRRFLMEAEKRATQYFQQNYLGGD